MQQCNYTVMAMPCTLGFPACVPRALSSCILLIAFVFLMECPVAHVFHKGDITCCCPSCGAVFKKKMFDKAAAGFDDTAVGWNAAPVARDAGHDGRCRYHASFDGSSVICPFLTTVKLRL